MYRKLNVSSFYRMGIIFCSILKPKIPLISGEKTQLSHVVFLLHREGWQSTLEKAAQLAGPHIDPYPGYPLSAIEEGRRQVDGFRI